MNYGSLDYVHWDQTELLDNITHTEVLVLEYDRHYYCDEANLYRPLKQFSYNYVLYTRTQHLELTVIKHGCSVNGWCIKEEFVSQVFDRGKLRYMEIVQHYEVKLPNYGYVTLKLLVASLVQEDMVIIS